MFVPHLRMPGSIFMFHMNGINMNAIAGCDVAVVQRLCTQENYKALQMMKQYGIKIIYDLDDNLWAIPPYNPAFKLFKQLEPGFRICAAECDMITVSTEPLRVAARNSIGRDCPPIEVMPNRMDFDSLAPVPEEMRAKRGDRVVVGWAGTNTHTGDVAAVFNIIPKLIERLPQLEFEFVGLPAPDCFKQDGKLVHPRVREREFVPIAEWMARWASWQWDASIAPLDRNKFNNSKSCLKALEAAALSIPCLMSNVAPYHDFCFPSRMLRSNVLCDSAGDWERKIEAIVVNAELRRSLGAEMYRLGRERYDVLQSVARWQEIAEAV